MAPNVNKHKICLRMKLTQQKVQFLFYLISSNVWKCWILDFHVCLCMSERFIVLRHSVYVFAGQSSQHIQHKVYLAIHNQRLIELEWHWPSQWTLRGWLNKGREEEDTKPRGGKGVPPVYSGLLGSWNGRMPTLSFQTGYKRGGSKLVPSSSCLSSHEQMKRLQVKFSSCLHGVFLLNFRGRILFWKVVFSQQNTQHMSKW